MPGARRCCAVMWDLVNQRQRGCYGVYMKLSMVFDALTFSYDCEISLEDGQSLFHLQTRMESIGRRLLDSCRKTHVHGGDGRRGGDLVRIADRSFCQPKGLPKIFRA